MISIPWGFDEISNIKLWHPLLAIGAQMVITLLMSEVDRFTCSRRFLIGWMLLLKRPEHISSNRALRTKPSITEISSKCYLLHNSDLIEDPSSAHLDTLHSKSMPSYSESTKQLALPRVDSVCLATSALFMSFIIALGLPVTSCL